MQGIVVSTQGLCNHTPYIAKWKMSLLPKYIT